jgi:hypothetical protein
MLSLSLLHARKMMSHQREFPVYNLEFKSRCKEFEIYGYRFRRIAGYKQALQSLHHRDGNKHSEFSILENTGIHAVTATVTLPARESKAVLNWRERRRRRRTFFLY